MSHTFISYARKDINIAERIVQALAENDLNTWVDWQNIPNAKDWKEEIFKGIEEADSFLFLISINSVTSQTCNEEIDHALKNGKRIIPLVIGNAKDGNVFENIHEITSKFILRHLVNEVDRRNFIFCREGLDEFKGSIEKIKIAILTDYEWVEAHRKLQLQALEWKKRSKKGGLLSGALLREAQEKLAIPRQKDPQPTDLQRLFVNESQKAETRTRSWILTIAGIVIAALAVLSLYANNQRLLAIDKEATAQANLEVAQTAQSQAEANLILAEERENISRSRELAAESLAIRENTLNLSLLLGIEAYNKNINYETKNVLLGNLLATPYQIGYKEIDHIESILVSPNGNFLVILRNTPYSGADVTLWNLTQSDLPKLSSTINEDEDVYFSTIALSPDSKILATAVKDGYYGVIKLWDISNLEKPIEIAQLKGHNNSIASIAFSHDGKLLAVGSYAEIQIWDISNPRSATHWGNALINPPKISNTRYGLYQEYSFITNVIFNKERDLLISESQNSICLWNLTNKENINLWGECFDNQDSYSDRKIKLSPNEDRLLVLKKNTEDLKVWNISNLESPTLAGQQVSTYQTSLKEIRDLEFSPDGAILFLAGERGIYAFKNNYKFESLAVGDSPTLHGLSSPKNIVVNITGNDIFTNDNNFLYIWDITDLSNPYTLRVSSFPKIENAIDQIYSSDSNKLLSINSSYVHIYNIKDLPKISLENTITMPKSNILSVSFNQKNVLALSTDTGYIALIDISTPGLPKEITKIFTSNSTQLQKMIFSDDGSLLVTGNDSGNLEIFNLVDIMKPERLSTIDLDQSYKYKIMDISLTPNNKYLIINSNGVYIWDISNIKYPKLINRFPASAYSYNPKREILALSVLASSFTNEKDHIKIYDFNNPYNPELIGEIQAPDDGRYIHKMVFNENGDMLSMSLGETVYLYDSTKLENLKILGSWRGNFYNFSPDGRTFASGSQISWLYPQGWVQRTCELTKRNLTQSEWVQYFPNEEYRKTCEQWDLETKVIVTPTATP